MTIPTKSYDEQSAVWNGIAGRAWADEQDLINTAFKPMEDRLVEDVWTLGPRSLLDVGCGTGATTLAAERVGNGAIQCVGIDVSEVMIAAARSRADTDGSSARFVCADAQSHCFAPGTFDLIMSRFGVMFFDDPVAAFRNLRRASTDTAQMRLLAFRSAAENAFMTTAERAARPLLSSVPERAAGPGQFAFADEMHVRSILGEAGWTGATLEPIDFDCSFPAEKLETFFTRLGPLGRILHAADPETRSRVVAAVHAAFEPFIRGDHICFRAACWMISARASG